MAGKEYECFDSYFKALKKDYETIDDLAVVGKDEPVNLESLYVPVTLSKKISNGENPLPGETRWGQDNAADAVEQSEKVLDVNTALKIYPYLLVTGPPGSGKTMMLNYLTHKMCRERNSIPIPVILRDFIKGKKDLRSYLNEIFEKYNCSKVKKPIERALEQGNCILLLDGLDEILLPKIREKVYRDIREFIKKYNRCRVLLTSRNIAAIEKPGNFTRLELLEFDDSRIKNFIHHWFETDNPGKIDSMLDLLMNNKDIEAFARNPLMISVIAALHEENDQVMLKRDYLYKRIIDLLLNDWDARKQIGNRFALPVKKHILRKLASRNHSRQRQTMTETEILDEIERHSFLIGFEKKKSRLLLEEIWQRSFLLRQLFKGTYGFPHIFFRHYFSALELIDREDGLDTIALHLSDPYWEESILLYAAIRKDATSLINIIQKKPEDIFYSNLILAGKCIAEADYTDLFIEQEITREIWQLIDTSDFQLLKERAIAVLARLRPQSIIDELMNKLTDKEPRVRQFAVETISLIGSAEVLPALMMILTKDNESKVRSYAASALGKTGSSPPIQPLLHVLHNDTDGEVRRSAAKALGSIRSSEAIPALLKTLHIDHDTNVRGGAAEALGEIGSTEPIPQLRRILSGEKQSSVRWRTAMALGKLEGTNARDLFIEALDNDKDKEVRESAAEGLGLIGNAECITALIKALSFDNDADVRGSAAYALGLIKSKEALPTLIKALITDENGEVRGRAAFALGRIKSKEAIPYLVAVFNTHKESIIRGNATYALGEIGGDEAIPFLIQALTLDKDSYVRFRAAEVLGSIGNVITIQPLKTALEDEGSYYGWKVKDKAYESLEKISKRCHVRVTWTSNKGE